MEAPVGKSFIYKTDFLSVSQLSHIFQLLKLLKMSEVKVKVLCPNQSLFQTLNKEVGKRMRSPKDDTQSEMLGKKGLTLDQIEEKKYKKKIDFSTKILTWIFINEFKAKLRQMGKQLDLYLCHQGTFIKVYSDQPISSMFMSQIVEMKRSIKYINFYQPEFCTKIRYSKYIRKQLENLRIKYIHLTRSQCIVLHSSFQSHDEIRQAKNKFSYDALILQFTAECYSRLINKIYFKLLMCHCEPFLAQISKTFQIKIEICWRKMGIVLHTPVPIFAEEPKSLLAQFLPKIIFISYFTTKTCQHLFHINSSLPNSKCFHAVTSKEILYTSWDTRRSIQPNQIAKVFSKLFQEVDEKTNLRIGFRTGGLNCNQIQKVEDLAEKHKLFATFPDFVDRQQMQIKFKSFPSREAKVDQLYRFLQQLLLKKPGNPLPNFEDSFSSVQQEQSVTDQVSELEQNDYQINM